MSRRGKCGVSELIRGGGRHAAGADGRSGTLYAQNPSIEAARSVHSFPTTTGIFEDSEGH